MLGDNKNLNLKDNPSPTLPEGKGGISFPLSLGEGAGVRLSYTKTNKLVTALYMVTDIMDKEEPLRNKLRTLGVNIISDSPSLTLPKGKGVDEILSLLDIVSTLGMISEMNGSILKKEFFKLKESLQESSVQNNPNNPTWLEEFLSSPSPLQGEGRGEVLLDSNPMNQAHPQPFPKGREEYSPSPTLPKGKGEIPIGHQSMRIGVQRGGTLLKALSDRMSDRTSPLDNNEHNALKKQRREEIIKIIKTYPNGGTITDIKNGAVGVLVECGEKTLQRELVSMVQDSVLEKTGEKRWSRYSIK